MGNNLLTLALMIALLPLLGSLIAGLGGRYIGRSASHSVTIGLLGLAFILATYLFNAIVLQGQPAVEGVLYTWAQTGNYQFDVALLVDRLSATMTFVVTFVSLMVHVYTVGYMADDPGYQRFFSYMSLFTFSMLILVLANNFLLMFFGWEGVGLVSYLLIGFWFKRESAVFGSLKAFLANRVADIAFILAIAAVMKYFGNVNFSYVFSHVATVVDQTVTVMPGVSCTVITMICLLLFIGAMGKSAQVPLHVWLPESMEGPTPISALIHAATMVTAGIYLVARMSPLFEFSVPSLSLVLIIGAITCLSMGILAVFHQDIKRVIAYSTLSQLGYMTVALGASAYDAAIFHLVTHAFFKALLFLCAGSVILAMHHEQDMRKMGGLAKYMPITYLTFMIGALSISAIPPLAGFYSKDAIIEAVHLSNIPGATFAYVCVMIGAFLTPLYMFRALFLTFHGEPRMDQETLNHVKESPWVVLIPLLLLAVPSVIAGGILVGPMLYTPTKLLGDSIFVLPQHNVLGMMATDFAGARMLAVKAGAHCVLWIALLGIITAWIFNLRYPALAERLKKRFSVLYSIIESKYGFDDFNQLVFVRGSRKLGNFFYLYTDLKIIDGIFVNGTGRFIRWFSRVASRVQTGYLYHYTFAIVLGLCAFLGWLIIGA